MQNSQESKNSGSSIYSVAEKVKQFFFNKISKFSSETLGWVAVLFLHGATIPGLLAMMTGLTDTPPPVDVVLMIWTGLLLLFAKAAVQRDLLNIITIGLGFMAQALMMMLIFFK
jgi:hypothetical protein